MSFARAHGALLELDLHVDAGREVELAEGVDRLLRRLEDVEQALVGADLELLARLLVDVRGAVHGEALDVGGKRDGAGDPPARPAYGLHDLAHRLVEQPVVVRLQADADLVVHARGYSKILVTTPAPTVRPPSRMAKRSPSSIAIGVMSSTFSCTLSPGITISVPSGRNLVCGVIEPGLASTWPRSISSRLVPRRRQPTLSPAMPSSRSLRNISTPVTTVFWVSRSPTISTSSPTLILPRSIRPVTTVPRPEIENTSSIGIRNGWSIARSGSGTELSSASNSLRIASSASGPFWPLSALIAEPRITGALSPGNWYLVKSSRTSSSTRSSSSGSSTTSTLLRNTTM